MFERRETKRTRNPFFSEKRMARMTVDSSAPLDQPISSVGQGRMTVRGAIDKSLLLGAIMLIAAVAGWSFATPVLMWGGAIGGLVVVIYSVWKPQHSPITAPIYAVLEGLFVGGVSAMYASLMNGIIFQAVLLTMAVFFLMLFLYKGRIIKVTQKFRSGVIMATGAVLVVYLLSWVLGMFGIQVPYLHEGGIVGIGISLVIIAIASFNLLLDFDNFDRGEAMGAPSYMEWFFAMGLIITIVWLYIEILRLLAIMNRD